MMFDDYQHTDNYYSEQCSRCKFGEWRGGCLNTATAEDGSDLDAASAGRCSFFTAGAPQREPVKASVRVSTLFKLPVQLWNGDVVMGEFAAEDVTTENAIRAVVNAYADCLSIIEVPTNGAPLHVTLTRGDSPKIESAATSALFTATYVKGYVFSGREDADGGATTTFTFTSEENT